MPDRLRMGLLGCASIAWRRTLPALVTADGVELTVVASRDPDKARRFAERFGGTPVHGYEALLERADVDAVYIPLPTGMHAEWVSRALSAGKHVLAEKPLTGTADEAQRLVAQASRAGRWLQENFMFLHHGQHVAVRKLVADGRIGTPRAFTAAFGIPGLDPSDVRYRPELGGGSLLDVGVYPIRSAQLLLSPELEVAGSVLRQDEATGVDVGGGALLVAPDGATAELSFGFERSYRCRYTLWGSAGHLTLDRAFTPGPAAQPVIRIESQDHAEEITLPADHQFRNIIDTFARSIRDGADFAPEAEAMVRQARLVDEIRNRAVRRTA